MFTRNRLLIAAGAIMAILGAAYFAATAAKAADKNGPANIFADAPVASGPASFSGLYISGSLAHINGSTDFGAGVDGYALGGRGGADLQVGALVLGAFVDGDWLHVSQFGGMSAREWSFGGRAGVIVSNSTMLYLLANRPTLTIPTLNTTVTGFGFGGGVETMLARNWAVGLEYKHEDFSTLGSGNPREDAVTARLTFRVPAPAFK